PKPPPPVALKVESTNPANQATYVPPNAPVVVKFNEPVDIATFTATNIQLYDQRTGQLRSFTARSGGDGSRVTLGLDAPLAVGRPYSLSLSTEVAAVSGHHLEAPYSITFTMGYAPDTASPSVVAVSVPSGQDGVPPNAPIAVAFSEPLDRTTLAS